MLCKKIMGVSSVCFFHTLGWNRFTISFFRPAAVRHANDDDDEGDTSTERSVAIERERVTVHVYILITTSE